MSKNHRTISSTEVQGKSGLHLELTELFGSSRDHTIRARGDGADFAWQKKRKRLGEAS
jgi:hypothetical protein